MSKIRRNMKKYVDILDFAPHKGSGPWRNAELSLYIDSGTLENFRSLFPPYIGAGTWKNSKPEIPPRPWDLRFILKRCFMRFEGIN